MTRTPAIAVLVLLAVTAVAFVRTQQQKLERTPIGHVEVERLLSPVCACRKAKASIGFSLRRSDTVTLEIEDADGERVRTLTRKERVGAGDHAWAWDGLVDDGRIATDGVYRPRLTLGSAARTFVMQNPIRVDTRAPRVTRFEVAPLHFSPDGDRRLDLVFVRYALDEPAHALLLVNGRRVEKTKLRPLDGTRSWNGKLSGKAQPAGRYAVSLAAVDAAGNVGRPTHQQIVTIRYVELARPLIRALARTRFGVGVRTDARSVRWRFARATGVARRDLLVLRAPRKPGRYTLFVTANGHAARADVVVRPRAAPRRRAGS